MLLVGVIAIIAILGLGAAITAVGVAQLERAHRPPGRFVPVAGGRLQVTKFMPLHNHPSPPDAWGFDQGDGRYLVQNLFFGMAGLFRVTLELTTAAGDDPHGTEESR